MNTFRYGSVADVLLFFHAGCKIWSPSSRRTSMPKYVIEREIPGVGNLKPEELQAISQKSCRVLKNMDHKSNGWKAL